MMENTPIRTYETADEAKKKTTYNAVLNMENYLIVSKYVYEELSANEATILFYLLDLENFYTENNKLNKYDYFYVSAKKIGSELGICSGTVNTAINKLVDKELFKEHKGKDNIRYIKSRKANVISFINECKSTRISKREAEIQKEMPWESDDELSMEDENNTDVEGDYEN